MSEGDSEKVMTPANGLEITQGKTIINHEHKDT